MDRGNVKTGMKRSQHQPEVPSSSAAPRSNVEHNEGNQVNVPISSENESNGTNGTVFEDNCEEPFVQKESTKLTGAKKELYQHVSRLFFFNSNFYKLF